MLQPPCKWDCLLPLTCLTSPGFWALLPMLFWLVSSPFWWHSTLPGYRSPFCNWNWHRIAIQKTKWKWSFMSKILFYKFKFEALAHYKVHRWEQWWFLNEYKLNRGMSDSSNLLLASASKSLPSCVPLLSGKQSYFIKRRTTKQRVLHAILGQQSIKVKIGLIGKCGFKADFPIISNHRRAEMSSFELQI